MGELARLFPTEIANDPKWPATASQGPNGQAKLLKYARKYEREFCDDMAADFARRRGDEAGLNELDPQCDDSDYNCDGAWQHQHCHCHWCRWRRQWRW